MQYVQCATLCHLDNPPVIRDFLPSIAEPVMDRWGEKKCRHADCHDCFPLDDSHAARHREIPVSEPREPSQHSPLGSCDNRAGVDDHSIGIFLVQMFYFLFIDKIILKYFIYPLSDFLPMTDFFTILIHVIGASLAIINCCVIGYGWFFIEKRWANYRSTTSDSKIA